MKVSLDTSIEQVFKEIVYVCLGTAIDLSQHCVCVRSRVCVFLLNVKKAISFDDFIHSTCTSYFYFYRDKSYFRIYRDII